MNSKLMIEIATKEIGSELKKIQENILELQNEEIFDSHCDKVALNTRLTSLLTFENTLKNILKKFRLEDLPLDVEKMKNLLMSVDGGSFRKSIEKTWIISHPNYCKSRDITDLLNDLVSLYKLNIDENTEKNLKNRSNLVKNIFPSILEEYSFI